jgi:predicted transcriptional regulator
MESDNERVRAGTRAVRGGSSVTESSVFRDVLGSTVRTDVLLEVGARSRPTEELKVAVEASESAVYNALGDLERLGLVNSVEGRWELTGSGRLVTDLLEQQDRLCQLLEDDYWETHDVGALPRRFRLRLMALADAEVFRAPETNPHAVVGEVVDRVEAGSPDVNIVTPIYQPEYEAVMPDSERARLIINDTVVEDALEDVDSLEEAKTFERTPVRILDTDVGVAVTDDHLMLSLPTADGQWDSRTEVLATDDRALAWGHDLFEHYWTQATPAEEFLQQLFT